MNVGKNIKNRREELGMTADQLAEKIGKNRATVYRYENGDIENLPTSVLVPIAEVLRCTPAYLMGWTDSEEDRPEEALAESDAELLDKFHRLSAEQQALVLATIDALLRK